MGLSTTDKLSENDGPATIIVSGCKGNNVSNVARGFTGAGDVSLSLLLSARDTAISRGSLDVVYYLIEQQ